VLFTAEDLHTAKGIALKHFSGKVEIILIRLLLRIASCGMSRRVALLRTDVSEELSASIIRVTGSVN
jgi:hypothetical protein